MDFVVVVGVSSLLSFGCRVRNNSDTKSQSRMFFQKSSGETLVAKDADVVLEPLSLKAALLTRLASRFACRVAVFFVLRVSFGESTAFVWPTLD